MNTTEIGERQEDFLGQILRLINNYETSEAIRRLKEIHDKDVLYEMLHNILNKTTFEFNIRKLNFMLGTLKSLARANIHTSDLNYNLGSEYNLSRAFARARNLVSDHIRTHDLARALARSRARELTRVLANALTNELTLVGDLALAITFANDLATALLVDDLALARIRARDLTNMLIANASEFANVVNARELTYIFEDFGAITHFIFISISDLNIYDDLLDDLKSRYQNRLVWIINEIEHLNHEEGYSPTLDVISTVIWEELENYPILLTLEGVDKITPSILSNKISPFFEAMDGLYQTHLAILADTQIMPEDIDSEIRIIKMHNSEPKFEISFGVSDFIRTLNDVFNFNKRRDQEELRKLQIEKARLDIDKDKLLTPIEIQSEQLEMMMKIARAEAELTEIYLEKAENYLHKYYPHLSDQQRIEYAPSVAKHLMQGQLTDLRIRMGWTRTPPPKKLPK